MGDPFHSLMLEYLDTFEKKEKEKKKKKLQINIIWLGFTYLSGLLQYFKILNLVHFPFGCHLII